MKKILVFTLIIFNLSIFNSFAQTYLDYYKMSMESLQKRDFENALKYAELSEQESIKVHGPESKMNINIAGLYGKIYFYQGNYEKAIEFYEKEKNLIEKLNGKADLSYARALNNLFVCYSSIGRGNEAEGILVESIEIKKSVGGDKDTSYAKSLNNLAMFYYEKGKYPEAEKLLVEALEIKKSKLSPNDHSTALTMMNLGMLYEGLGNRTNAVTYLEDAYAIMKTSLDKSHPDRSKTAFQLASLYVLVGKKDLADKITKENSNDMSSGEMTVDVANSIYNYAQLQVRLKKEDLAKKALTDAIPKVKVKLGMRHPLYSKMIKLLGITKWMTGDLEGAYELFQENLEIIRVLYGEKNIQYASAKHNVAGLMKDLKYFDMADEAYAEAFDIYFYQLENYFPYFSEAEKTNFYRMMKERFDMFNSYALSRQLDNPKILNQMYNYHIKTKGILLDYSKNIANLIEKSGNNELLNTYKDFIIRKEQLSEFFNKSQQELAMLGIDLEQFENKTNQIERDISLEISKISGKSNSNLDWKAIQSKLKSNEAAVEIIRFNFYTKSRSDSTLYAVLILTAETTEFPELLILDNASELDGVYLKRYKKTIKAKFPDNKSYLAYWDEIDRELGDKEIIYLSGDGVFNLINIGSLRKPDGTFVLDTRTIVNLNNTKEMLASNQTQASSNQSLLFGSPAYELSNSNEVYKKSNSAEKDNQILISPLPGTAIEIEKISNILKEKNNKFEVYTEDNASELNFRKADSPRILHIATHGYFLTDVSEVDGESVFGIDVEKAVQNPLLRSGLLFSGASNFLNYDASKASGDNGILTAYEVMNMDLRGTELVVMSACETGLGEVMNGEGVYGLQRAFQVAGAKSIIMSLWTVDDKTTQELMVEFYTRYLGGMEKIQAFKEARLEIKNRYEDPYYWGAFKLLGME